MGVVLNVGTAHVGEFGSREAIATAKGDLVESIPPADQGGVAVLNADDELVAAMAPRTTAAVVTYGTDERADIRATGINVTAGPASFPPAHPPEAPGLTRPLRAFPSGVVSSGRPRPIDSVPALEDTAPRRVSGVLLHTNGLLK
ncbi:Mur ligase family protein [Streptomyces sp. NPDC055134]